MSAVLADIIVHKRAQVRARKARVPYAAVLERAQAAPAPRGFAAALRAARDHGRFGLICEIKKASPSRGLIRADFHPPALARAYELGGATCLSVLTDEKYFQGHDDFLVAARAATALPVLRKDFMVDPYQIAESRALGADCVLLILSALSQTTADELESLALSLGMDVLIEIHNEAEAERAIAMKSPLIGINNRDLTTMTVSLETTMHLAPGMPPSRLVIAESGLRTRADLDKLAGVGVSCFLIGESLMREADIARATRRLWEPAS
ncbi:MAG: indole-3-glycerol phosphate synthase TrpC [Alphaproteobacteria bacterium]|nr:MAG: indole-3-glycerol phosphate synthase TrpC [Alphaproteobacteria bacterium]